MRARSIQASLRPTLTVVDSNQQDLDLENGVDHDPTGGRGFVVGKDDVEEEMLHAAA